MYFLSLGLSGVWKRERGKESKQITVLPSLRLFVSLSDSHTHVHTQWLLVWFLRKQQAHLAPILTGWKRWMEFNTTRTDKRLPASWLMNLRRAGSISTNTVEKAVTWNVGPHRYPKGKKEINQIFEQGPPHYLPAGCTDPQKTEKCDQKRTPTGVPPLLDLHHHGPEYQERLQRLTICIFGLDSSPLGFFP